MKTKTLIALLTLATFTTIAQQVKTLPQVTTKPEYTLLWKEVSQFENQSLPQSAMEKVNDIYKKALADKNSPQLIKTLIYQLKYQSAIDRDQLPDRLSEIEQYTRTAPDKVEQSVLYAVLSQLYFQYYQTNAYKISQRTAITGYFPEDIREWPGNLFVQRIADYVKLSLQAEKDLQSTDIKQYKSILGQEEFSQNLSPTLYDFVINQGVNVLAQLYQVSHRGGSFNTVSSVLSDRRYFAPVADFVNQALNPEPYDLRLQVLKMYQEWLAFHRNDSDPKILLITDLDRLKFVYDRSESEDKSADYLNALEILEKKYANNDICVEVLYKKARFYDNSEWGIIPLGENEADRQDILNKIDQEKNRLAYEICQDGIRRFPRYERIGLLENYKNQLSAPRIEITAKNTVYTGKSLELKVNHRNTDALTVEIYRIMAPVSVYENTWNLNDQYKKRGKLTDKKVFQLKNEFPYVGEDTVIRIDMKDPGCYEYVIYSEKDKSQLANSQFSVSQLAVLGRTYSGIYEFLVTDRISGKPVSGAKVNIYKKEKNQQVLANTILTGKDGIATMKAIEKNTFSGFNASLGRDSALAISPMPWGNLYQPSRENTRNLQVITDRNIYRPGQTVYFKGIAYNLSSDQNSVLSNENYTVSLRNANQEEVAKKTLKTNEFGSFSGEFILPRQVLNGSFSIGTEEYNERAHFQVEEYKRPSFDLQFSPNEQTFHFGDTVVVKGNARTFSGVNIQGLPVKYRVVRLPHWLWRAMFNSEVQVEEGTVRTDGEGGFEVRFPAEKKSADEQRKDVYYTYEVQVSLTDEKGETQEAFTSVSVGDKSMYLRVEGLEGKIDKNQLPKTIINGFNLDGKAISCSGTFRIHQLKAVESLEKTPSSKDWKTSREVTSGTFVSGEAILIAALGSEQSGNYRISIQSNDDQGRAVTDSIDFVLYSTSDKQPPLVQYEWFLTPKTTCAPGESAEIIYGSSAKDVSVLYELFGDGKKLQSNRFELSNSNRQLLIPFEESYGEGVVVFLTFVKDNRIFTREIEIKKKKEDRNLKLQFDVFRDKLLPGQQEEWKLIVKDANGQPVQGEILAGMYDKSLDKLYPGNWNFHPDYMAGLWRPSSLQGNSFGNISDYLYLNIPHKEFPNYTFGAFNWFGFSFYGGMMIRGISSTRVEAMNQSSALDEVTVVGFEAQKKASVVGAVQTVSASDLKVPVALSENAVVGRINIDDSQEGGGSTQQGEEALQVRQNFNETAFFYPQLRTNEAGETLIAFTVPESNTTWKFQALAHTKDLKYGSLIKEAVSQKKLMVSPNMPRFIRQGDKTTISTTISNLSGQDLNGTVSIEFFDPNTQHTTITVDHPQIDFSVVAGKTTAVSWTVDVPAGIDLTACKIVAKTDLFSDGEQHLLPVLPNRMLVTESLPLSVSGKQTKTFTLEKLVKNNLSSIENYRLTLEFASNPAWYAVQALPAMTTPSSENVISWFAAYYANSLAVSIANSTPRIKQVIDTWMQQGGSKETLLSNLEKNQELKTVLLEETPWVLEAKDETEQKQQLSLLFDINRSANLSSSAVTKLKELQLEDGGWTWFKGMNSSTSITQWILYGMGELTRSKAITPSEDIKAMQTNALAFIDRKFKENYENLKKYDKDWKKKTSISTYELEYLFVRSFYPEIEGQPEEAVRFYSRIVDQYWTNHSGLYERAIAAILLNRTGKTTTAQAILKSLREHASRREDLGMYWANNNARTFMFQSATGVHTFIMQAFEEAGASAGDRNAMKLWLLKQKQTQQWESTPATVNAVSVLLQTGTNWLDNKEQAVVHIGNEQVGTEAGEAGTGYFKKVYEAASIRPEMGKVSVSKKEEGPAWGALYWQYFEDVDNVSQAKTGLQVDKKLFVENVTASGKSLEPVTETRPLQVGDKVVVRLTNSNDRAMEYVMLKDLRGACFEPVEQISGTSWKERVIYYQTSRDASTQFYFDHLPKGTYVFEYSLYVARTGEYSNGNTTIQCLYAPEYISHTAGTRVVVK